MASPKLKKVISVQGSLIKPSEEELKIIEKRTREVVKILENNLRKEKTSADVFVGGSFAKGTLIRKDKYDVDIFVRFDVKYGDEKISSMLSKFVPKNARKIHGSRDYFSINEGNLTFEIIPVLKIKNAYEAKNITDLSYFHVNYIQNKIKKNKKLADEIRLAKAFAFYQNCYGAESYINGFSGYGIELIIAAYGSFIKFISEIAKFDLKTDKKENKIILDSEKLYKNKDAIMKEMNESKLLSPIVLVDPTFKGRNALAALSLGTFLKLKNSCKGFLKNPSEKFFEFADKEKLLEKKYGNKLLRIELSTEKQAGDIAGTKLKKFSGFFLREAEKYFEIKASEFSYDDNRNIGRLLLTVEARKEIVFPGPPVEMKKPLAEFRKAHKKIRIIKGRAFAYEKNKLDFNGFLRNFENEKRKFIDEMDVSEIKRI